MPVQNSPVPTVTMPSIAFKKLVDGKFELQKQNKEAEIELKAAQQAIEFLKNENATLKNTCTEFKEAEFKEETLIQLIDENLQSSNRVLQCVCAVAGAILGGGLVLAFPVVAAPAIALAGTGPAAAGIAVAGGAAGGYLVAPVIHKKINNELIQQVQNFKAKEEVSKKVE
ncbi:MAG: hypothetical protein ACRDAI_03465 [Candidatus Rhabdochlamydia sp.]